MSIHTPTRARLQDAITTTIRKLHCGVCPSEEIRMALVGKLPSDIYHMRNTIGLSLARSVLKRDYSFDDARVLAVAVERAIAQEYTCYAGKLHLMRGADGRSNHQRDSAVGRSAVYPDH